MRIFAGSIKIMIALIMTAFLCACGGGGNNSLSTSLGGAQPISGAGVKGPLAFANVSLYSLDTSNPGFYDPQSPVATASTNARAEIVGLQIPQNISPPFVMVVDGTNAIDLNTGTTPVITTLITVISQDMIDAARPIYATPLTTMAFYMARLEAGTGATNSALQIALTSASNQISSTIGFGMSPNVDIFTTPPVINNYTTSVEEQQSVAEYRASIEALAAMLYEMSLPKGNGLKAEYFNGVDLTNSALIRTDATVNFDWGTGAPAPTVNSDGFSVRWTGLIEPAYSETYTFYTDSDDGVRLWVNGQLLIDNWTDHGATEDSATITLVAGQKYTIKMEYYDRDYSAVAKLLWSSPSQPKEVIPQDRLLGSTAADILAQTANSLLEHLAYDLQSDGIIDNSAAGVAIGDIDTAILVQDPATLVVPNTSIAVGDIASLLDNELSLTNTTTPFYKQDITINLQPAVLDPIQNSNNRALTLSWMPSPDVDGYIVYYGSTASTAITKAVDIPVNTVNFDSTSPSTVINSWDDLRMPIGTNVCFAIRAYNSDGVSPASTPVCSVI